KANPMVGSEFCFTHNPDTEQQRLVARKKGGKVSYYRDGLMQAEPIDFSQYKEAIVCLLADTINRVRRIRSDGSIDIKVANCIGFLVAKLLEAQKQLVLEEKVDELVEKLTDEGILK
ncbi:MAG: hypothetical protein NUV85_04420, partial [Candidatus Berkelbacteria bacterium]|nr:hypothetical protein [Candidatus Berkelbacteria bacterium]